MTEHVTHVTHPLVQHKLTLMRKSDTSTAVFRQLLREISQLLAYEVTRELPLTTEAIETPMQPMDAPVLAGKKLALVSILRAGNGLLDGVLELIPSARVGFVGSTGMKRRSNPCSITSRCQRRWKTVWSSPSIRCLPPEILRLPPSTY